MIDNKIEVLNKGYIRFIDKMGSDLSIVRAARVSYNSDWRNSKEENDRKLIHFLLANEHTSPFESATLTFEIKAPIFVFRQWHRHRTWSYNEVSARYTSLPNDFYIPLIENIGKQSKSNKQARDINIEMSKEEKIKKEFELQQYNHHLETSFQLYEFLLNSGWPKELARTVLPFSIYSRMFATVNLLNLFKFLKLRLHEHVQFETRVYAEAMYEITKNYFPIACEAFKLYWIDKKPYNSLYFEKEK